MTWKKIGIDPAPSKNTAVCEDGHRVYAVSAREISGRIDEWAKTYERLLIAWDAPLSFSSSSGLYDRPIDRWARNWVQRHAGENPGFERSAIGVGAFAALSHWAVTLASLGIWIDGKRASPKDTPGRNPIRLAPKTFRPELKPGCYVIEVHPAVAMGVRWLERGEGQMPRYKIGKGVTKPARTSACRSIAEELDFPGDACIPAGLEPDDVLDARAAWRLADEFERGEACWVGSTTEGGYVLPKSDRYDATELTDY